MASKTTDIGMYGFVPELKALGGKDNSLNIETTVLTMGSMTSRIGAFFALVHALTWIIAAVVIGAWGNAELDKIVGATDAAKMLGSVYCLFIIAIVLMVLIHSALARKQDQIGGTFASILLLTMVGFENTLGCAYVAYSLILGNSNFYSAAVVSQLLVCLASAMIVAFYVNWSHNGNVNDILA